MTQSIPVPIRDHTKLKNIGTASHPEIDTAIDTTLPGLVTTHAALTSSHGVTTIQGAAEAQAKVDTHADLAALHNSSLFRYRRAGRYYSSSFNGYNDNIYIDANMIFAIPFAVVDAITVTRMAIHVTSAYAGSARLGIYSDDGNLYPSALVIDAGTVDVSTTGLKEIVSMSTGLSAGSLYWLVIVSDTTPYMASIISSSIWSLLGFEPTSLNDMGYYMWTVAFTFAALPATFPAGALPQNDQGTFVEQPKIGVMW